MSSLYVSSRELCTHFSHSRACHVPCPSHFVWCIVCLTSIKNCEAHNYVIFSSLFASSSCWVSSLLLSLFLKYGASYFTHVSLCVTNKRNGAAESNSERWDGHKFLRRTYVPLVTAWHLSVIPTDCLYHRYEWHAFTDIPIRHGLNSMSYVHFALVFFRP